MRRSQDEAGLTIWWGLFLYIVMHCFMLSSLQ
nr:MAG TPA: hypothetical protein [Herelleviridae sp.]